MNIPWVTCTAVASLHRTPGTGTLNPRDSLSYDSPPHARIISPMENLGVNPACSDKAHPARRAASACFPYRIVTPALPPNGNPHLLPDPALESPT